MTTRERIKSLILESPVGMTNRDLMRAVGVSSTAVLKHAAALRQAGLIALAGAGRGRSCRWCRPGMENRVLVEVRLQQVRRILPPGAGMMAVLNMAARLERRNAYRRGEMTPPGREAHPIGVRCVWDLASC